MTMRLKFLLLAISLALTISAFGQSSTNALTAQATTCVTPNNTSACVFLRVTPDVNTGGASIQGTFSGTLQFEATIDNTTWNAIQAFPIAGGSSVTSATAAGSWQITPGGAVWLRIRCSTYTSGSATATLNPSQAVTASLSGGGGGSGTVTSVTGTANQITVGTGTTTPALSIPSTFIAPGTISAATSIDATKLTGNLPAISGASLTSVNAATLGSATFAAPGAIGSGTANTGAFTTVAATGAVSGA